MTRKKSVTASPARSSAAEFRTFVAASRAGGIEAGQRLPRCGRGALRKISMTMQDWEKRLSRFLVATDHEVWKDVGRVTAEIARAHAESEFEKYRIVQDRLFESDFDRIVAETKLLEDKTKSAKPRKSKGRKKP